MTNESLKELILESNEKYRAIFPCAFALLDEKKMMNKLEEIFLKDSTAIKDITTTSLMGLLDYYYPKMIVSVIFSSMNKYSFEKNLAGLYENTLCNPRAYKYFMANMPEFKEFSESLSIENQRRFQKVRRFKTTYEILSAICSCGLSAVFSCGNSEKTRRELAENPLAKEIFRALTLMGNKKNDD